MEHKIISPKDKTYSEKLAKRLNPDDQPKLCYSGPLNCLNKFTMAVICSDESGGITLMETNQLLFTIREYELNYIGSWHSIIETEIFRLGLFRKNTTVTLFSAKGLESESYESYLLDRFYPPLDKFPERDEYFRRSKENELLMLSVSEPEDKKQSRQNVMRRNWIACMLADIIFIPYGPKGSKTYTTAKKLIETKIPIFTLELEECSDLHQLGIPKFNRKTVSKFLEDNGAKLAVKIEDSYAVVEQVGTNKEQSAVVKEPTQLKLDYEKK